jgi:hypothetical protein
MLVDETSDDWFLDGSGLLLEISDVFVDKLKDFMIYPNSSSLFILMDISAFRLQVKSSL